MECQVLNSAFSDYLDGGLPSNEVRTIETHLDGCQRCQILVRELDEVRQAARELPLHAPNPELWTRIRAGIIREMEDFGPQVLPEPAESWWRRLFQRRITLSIPQLAGAGSLALALTILGTIYFSPLRGSEVQPRLEEAVAALLPGEKELKEQIKQQVEQINQRKAAWDPEVRAGFEHHLARIDQSIEGCRRKLINNPQDRDHQQMVLTLYQEKLRLLEDVNRLNW